jgi:RNA polymerase sigma-70 factor (ECF subfamily)
MLRAYAARGRFRSGTSMRAWLATILRRLFLTASITERRRRTRPETDVAPNLATDEVGPLDRPAGPDWDPARGAAADIRDHMGDRLHKAYTELPDSFRQPFVLFALDGLSYAEIAARLRIPVGTVMSRIHRARTKLREGALSSTTSEI